MGKIKIVLFITTFLVTGICYAQIVEEKIQLDTTFHIVKVIVKPISKSTYYYKTVAVYADDTAQIAVEKSFTYSGQNGVYKAYYPTGKLKVKTVYANDKINGEWTWYDPEGVILVKGIYKKGIKHGYWAYKSHRIYGRYKKGKKNGKWYFKNPNDKKIVSNYKNGVLIKGEGFANDNKLLVELKDSSNNESNNVNIDNNLSIGSEYEQAIDFLRTNIVFKKEIKEHFAKGDMKEIRAMKKYFVRNKFQFVVAPAISNLDMASFLQESRNGEIVVSAIDSVLKIENLEWYNSISKVETFKYHKAIYELSTNKESVMTIYFSDIENGLLRIDVLKLNQVLDNENYGKEYINVAKAQKFQILLFFNEKGQLKGAEYQKSQ